MNKNSAINIDNASSARSTEAKSPFIKKADVLLIVLLLIICALFLVPKYLNHSTGVAVVYSNGKEIERIDLSKVKEPYTIKPECTPEVVITVEPGTIYYSHADCHDKLCVNCGKLTRPGDTAACLPSKTLVVIEGEKTGTQPDVITY